MLRKALACAALIAAATALGTVPAAANDDDRDHGSFGALEWNKGKFAALESAGGSEIAVGGWDQGGAIDATW